MITLTQKDSGAVIGTITEADLKLLVDSFEEESSTDRDYYIDEQTVQMLQDNGAEPTLCALLRKAIGTTGGTDIVWSRG
ncbi:hypothetical protein [Arenimonas sp. MALMAid1274]|uniref:hypothetical protein n=1 Tax=Arenimonas sp. MALMAid1274 TaxID=3411630 RepID=UPI003BA30BBC